jgi:2-octaprenyl-3-methyl-6-methoxy-1,4-benzoquinol hydroxylase/2-octaprenylphenol hydroxylase
MSEKTYDVLLVGAGMVGAAAACLLARAGFSVAIIEAVEPQAFDPSAEVGLRVSAFSPGSADVLAEAGAWRQIESQRHCAYRKMLVEDRGESVMLEFNAPEFGLERLGTIIENHLVQWSLWQSLQAMGGVEIVCPERIESLDQQTNSLAVTLASGRILNCRLLVGADGANSRVRKMLGIEQQHWEYGQHGLVTVVETEQVNPGVAWQRFMPGGPLAFLPLQNGSSSIVWSRPQTEARRLLELDDVSFLTELQEAAWTEGQVWPGVMRACGSRAAFPLTMRLSHRYAGPRAVLIGDAAHVVHPLAGQGVNLGLLDAAGLVEVLIDARSGQAGIASTRTLRKYERWRRSETEIMARGIHGIRGLFTPESLAPLRKLGLGLVARSWTAKEAFIKRAAGKNRNAPALARGEDLTDMLRTGAH